MIKIAENHALEKLTRFFFLYFESKYRAIDAHLMRIRG
jgi:hypothetical protein